MCSDLPRNTELSALSFLGEVSASRGGFGFVSPTPDFVLLAALWTRTTYAGALIAGLKASLRAGAFFRRELHSSY